MMFSFECSCRCVKKKKKEKEIKDCKTDEKDRHTCEDQRRGQAAVREKRSDATTMLTCNCNSGLLEGGILLLGLMSAMFLSGT